MAWIEMNRNLRKRGQFFQVFGMYFGEKMLKTDYSLFFLEKSLNIFFPALKEELHVREKVPCQTFEHFYQNQGDLRDSVP